MFRRRKYERAEPDVPPGPIESILEAFTISERLAGGTAIKIEDLPASIGLTDMYATVVSSFPMVALGPNGQPLTPQPLAAARPDATEEQGETLDAIVRSLVERGNAYGLLAGDWPFQTVRVLNPNLVTPCPRPDDDRAVAYWLLNGDPVPVDRMAHWRVRENPRRGPLGHSPLTDAKKALLIYTAAYEYLAGFFASGGNPSSILHSSVTMDDLQMREHIAEWIKARRERRPAMLPPHLRFEVPQGSTELAMVQNVIETASAEIGRIFNAPPSITNAAVAGYSLTYSNVTDDLRRWIALSLRPMWLKAIEQGFSRTFPPGVSAHLDTKRGPIAELISAAAVEPSDLGRQAMPVEVQR